MTNPLISLIEKSAPLLAGAIGGPFASVAVQLISSMFGADGRNINDVVSKITTDPEAEIKLKKLEYDHQEALELIKSQQYAKEHDDIDDARDFIKDGNHRHTVTFLIIACFVSISLCFWALYWFDDDKSVIALISALLTTLMHQLHKIYSLFFGDSKDNV